DRRRTGASSGKTVSPVRWKVFRKPRGLRADLHVMPGERQERQAMAHPWRRNWNRREDHSTAYEGQRRMTTKTGTARAKLAQGHAFKAELLTDVQPRLVLLS